MEIIDWICSLPVAARLRYSHDQESARGRFEIEPCHNGIPESGAVYFLVDNKGRLQKIGMTDSDGGLKSRLKDYRVPSGGKDATPNLYYRMMTEPLKGKELQVHFRSFEMTQLQDVCGANLTVRYTAHRFIESHLRDRVLEARQGRPKKYPLWLEKGMYQGINN